MSTLRHRAGAFGADYVLDAVGFDRLVGESDRVVIGEGRLDSQTGQGKIIWAILARSGGFPVYAVVGSVGADLGEYATNSPRSSSPPTPPCWRPPSCASPPPIPAPSSETR